MFSRLPDRYRHPDPANAWSAANRGRHAVDSFLEGTVWHPSGCLYVTDIPYGRISRIDMSDEWELVVQYQGEPNGMKLMDDDTLLITDYQNGLMKLSLADRRITPWLTRRRISRSHNSSKLTITGA